MMRWLGVIVKAPPFALPALTLLIGETVSTVVGAVVGAGTDVVKDSERLDVALGLLTIATTPLHATPSSQPSRMTNDWQDDTLEKTYVEAEHLPQKAIVAGKTCSPCKEYRRMLVVPEQAPPKTLHGDKVTSASRHTRIPHEAKSLGPAEVLLKEKAGHDHCREAEVGLGVGFWVGEGVGRFDGAGLGLGVGLDDGPA